MEQSLASDGLLAQIFAWAQRWQDDLARQWHAVAVDPLESGQAASWWQNLTAAGSNDSHQALLALATLLALALLAQGLLAKLLQRPRQALYAHALRYTSSNANHGSAPDQGLLALKRLPYILASALLQIIPWIAALIVLSILQAQINWLGNATVDRLAYPVAQAWLLAAGGLVLIRVATAPQHPEVRLLPMGDAMANLLQRSLSSLVILMAIGLGLTGVMAALGAPNNLVTLGNKIVGLLVHLWLIALVWQTRNAVKTWLTSNTESRWFQWGQWLGASWPVVATILIALFWLTWTFSATDGLSRAANIAWRTLVVLLLSRILWIAISGLLERWQTRLDPVLAAIPSQHLLRYQRLLRGLALVIVLVLTLFALFYAWGFPVGRALEAGSLGSHLLSATLTITVAIIAAVIAWEGISLALQKRVQHWTAEGDPQRAARLRTLTPIIRLILLIAIGLIVILTALSELGVNTAPLLASASIFGLAIGFGSQKLVQDFMTGLFLLLENSMQVGEQVTVSGVTGTVEGLSLRTVRLRASDGSVFFVPYSSVTTVNNFNRGLGLAVVRFMLPTDTDPAPLEDILRQTGNAMRADPAWAPSILEDISVLGIESVNGTIATVAAQIRTTDSGRSAVQRELMQRTLLACRERGIVLANVTSTR